jgi:hypothetical protein
MQLVFLGWDGFAFQCVRVGVAHKLREPEDFFTKQLLVHFLFDDIVVW